MKIKGYIISAVALIFIIYLFYFIQFSILLDYKISNDSSVWGQFGDYVGGVLNPLLSFVSITLLIKSILLQHEANSNLKTEVRNNAKTEKIRSFEIFFFNLISSQRNIFESFNVVILTEGVANHLVGAKAVIEIENIVNVIRARNGKDTAIAEFLDGLDDSDQIFGLSRAFYIIVMMITDKLSDVEGFSVEDRKAHFKALINLTDFAQLRIIMICVRFSDYESAKYVRESNEFKNILVELGFNYKLY